MLPRSVIPLEHTPVLRVPEVGCNVELRRSSRAKRFSLKVSHTERAVILTLPNRGRVEDASAFLARHAGWLKKQLERLPEPVPFTDGAVIPLRGEMHCLKFKGAVRNTGVVSVQKLAEHDPRASVFPATASLRCSETSIVLAEICISGEKEHAPRRFSDWLRAEVRKDIAVSVSKHAKTLDCAPKRIAIRDQDHALGVLFDKRYSFFFMAAHLCAAICFGLRRGT